MSEVPQTRPVATPQVAELHQENQSSGATTALGCVVAPDNAGELNVENLDAGEFHVLTDGNRVQILIRIRYSDEAATAEVRQKFNRAIEKYWTGKFGKYTVKTIVQEVSEGPSFNPKVVDRRVVSNMNGRGLWDAQEEGWMAAHEIGHGMEVGGDRYDQRTGQPDPGFEGNIMGERGGIPSPDNIEAVINTARRRDRNANPEG